MTDTAELTGVPPHRRDPAGTRQRIVDAALQEFAARGFAGARVQSIARRAGVNARMLYHYFGDKDDLFRAILRRRLAERPARLSDSQRGLAAQMAEWFGSVVSSPDWVRLNQWEALEAANRPVVEEDARRTRWAAAVDRIRAEQDSGRLVADLEPDLMLLALISLTTFPVGASPLVRMVTGHNPTDPAFKRRYAAFLERLSGYLTNEEVSSVDRA